MSISLTHGLLLYLSMRGKEVFNTIILDRSVNRVLDLVLVMALVLSLALVYLG